MMLPASEQQRLFNTEEDDKMALGESDAIRKFLLYPPVRTPNEQTARLDSMEGYIRQIRENCAKGIYSPGCVKIGNIMLAYQSVIFMDSNAQEEFKENLQVIAENKLPGEDISTLIDGMLHRVLQ